MANPHAARLDRAREQLSERGVDALLIGPSADLVYLTGYQAPPLERLTLLVLPAKGDPRLVVPRLEAPLARDHLGAGPRVIRPGDAVVVDIGGRRAGYCSDTTRTLVVGEPPPGFAELYRVLQAAQESGCAAVAPGVPAAAVDAACRDPIAAAGYGGQFVHRTGHGIGLEDHEDPYIVAGNAEPLAAGMAFSVEPGIYLEGRYGARIEDVVVCSDGGARRLNTTSRDLRVVA